MMSKVSQTSRATFSFWWKIVFCCPRCFPLSKGKRKSRRIGQIYSKQLDIERLVSNSIGLRDFLRCYLTTNQRILLAHQRTRVAKESDYSQKSSSETSSDDETAEKYDAEKFKKRMEGFQPTSKFEQNLVKGVIHRHGTAKLGDAEVSLDQLRNQDQDLSVSSIDVTNSVRRGDTPMQNNSSLLINHTEQTPT